MDKEKLSPRKRSSTDAHDTLPSPPPSPQPQTRSTSVVQVFPDAFKRLLEYKSREAEFLKTLDETIAMDCKKLKSESSARSLQYHRGATSDDEHKRGSSEMIASGSAGSEDYQDRFNCELLREECENFAMPLLNRTGPSISAALVTYDAFEQLNKLHGLLDQLLHVQNQNYRMQRQVRDVRTLCELKTLQKKDALEQSNDAELSDNELDLNAILAAGNSASIKRSIAKRQRERSKSVIADDIQMFTAEKEKTSSLRRQSQSAYTDSKSKVSKWTKVKAAFKWERANVAAMHEGKSLDSGISLGPMNHEVARYLRVPSVPCTGSSADSVLSSSSGHLLSGGSVPATPGTISSASSIEDVGGVSEEIRINRDSSKSDSRCDSRANEDESRRSRSLDGDAIISQSLPREGKNKTPWRKVKDIIQTHRGSFKGKSRSRSVKSSGTCSREHSPCESIDALSNIEDRNNDNCSSNPASPVEKSLPSLSVSHDSGTYSYSPNGSTSGLHSREDSDGKSMKSSSKGSRKSKILPDFEVLPEDVIVDVKPSGSFHHGKPPPSPLNLRQDSSDAEYGDLSYSPTFLGKSSSRIFKPRKALASGHSSVPSSPSRHSEFFGEFDNFFKFPDTNLHSEDFSSGDYSEPSTPHHHKLSPKSSLLVQQKEIDEKYLELREQLSQEFEAKREEWKKIQAACAASTSTAYQMMSKEEGSISSKNVPVNLLEENLSPDFKKKLHKWRVKKQCSITTPLKDPQISPTKETDQKKIDWNLWKTGQLKLEGQGLTPMPGQKDLPEDFQKKLEQWRKLKESNAVPPYNSQDSLKRTKKIKDEPEKFDREKQRPDREKLKSHERDKLEKLSKLKAMVTADIPAKEIEVRTSKGVMKFEGISRKFTRKLYEWEKARGIGPESSTFALLHPGYRPLDVGNGSQDNPPQENSPVLGRSLSLDSISPNPSVPSISHQPSSLSLNDMKESSNIEDNMKDGASMEFGRTAGGRQEEPEAVIVEVEDYIVDTAAPLVTAHPIFEHQTPVYRYEIPCNELCTGKSATVLSEGSSTLPKRLSTQALHNVSNLRRLQSQQDDDYRDNVKHVQIVLTSLKDSLPDLERCMRGSTPQGYETLNIIKNLVSELMQMLDYLILAEAFTKEELGKRTAAIDIKLSNLQKSINLVCRYIETRKLHESIPEINIISDEVSERGRAIVSTTPTVFQSEVVINQPRVLIDTMSTLESSPSLDPIRLDPGEGCSRKVNRTVSNGSKKKMRLRKMGSRQNSKTESDSDEDSLNIVLEAPRRIKRKTSKAKKAPEEERKQSTEPKKEESYGGEDIVYVLKVKPGHKIEQETKSDLSERNVLISPTELCVELLEGPPETVTSSANIFVKTKRKVFTTVDEASGGESKVAVSKDIESSSASERTTDKDTSNCESEKAKATLKTLPPIPQSPNAQRRPDFNVSPLKEPSPSIRLMIAKYNQKVEKSKKLSSGSCSPVALRSPVLERRVKNQTEKYQQKVEQVVKSSSVGNIRGNELVAVNISEIDSNPEFFKISRASSAEALPSSWKATLSSEPSNASPTQDDNMFSPPLACDSLKSISKTCTTPEASASYNDKEKKEHLYRKNKEKPTSLFGKAGAIKKIGMKTGTAGENIWRRSLSNTPSESWSLPDKSDNTVPKITRKYEVVTDIFSKSAPTTPMDDNGEQPKTPISERAMKLQRAKEEFLQGNVLRSSTWDGNTNKDEMWLKRLSGSSFGSVTSNEPIECTLLKSASVGFIDSSPSDSQHPGGYDSLPRTPSRTEKSNKFGFSSIASKFRKVKMRRGSKDTPRYNAVSALCRQSLAVVDLRPDANALQQNLKKAESDKKVFKSISSHGTGFWSGLRKLDKLVKSKSANVLPQNDNDDDEN